MEVQLDDKSALQQLACTNDMGSDLNRDVLDSFCDMIPQQALSV
jgi:hypothetical protein